MSDEHGVTGTDQTGGNNSECQPPASSAADCHERAPPSTGEQSSSVHVDPPTDLENSSTPDEETNMSHDTDTDCKGLDQSKDAESHATDTESQNALTDISLDATVSLTPGANPVVNDSNTFSPLIPTDNTLSDALESSKLDDCPNELPSEETFDNCVSESPELSNVDNCSGDSAVGFTSCQHSKDETNKDVTQSDECVANVSQDCDVSMVTECEHSVETDFVEPTETCNASDVACGVTDECYSINQQDRGSVKSLLNNETEQSSQNVFHGDTLKTSDNVESSPPVNSSDCVVSQNTTDVRDLQGGENIVQCNNGAFTDSSLCEKKGNDLRTNESRTLRSEQGDMCDIDLGDSEENGSINVLQPSTNDANPVSAIIPVHGSSSCVDAKNIVSNELVSSLKETNTTAIETPDADRDHVNGDTDTDVSRNRSSTGELEDQLLSELDAELEPVQQATPTIPNGLRTIESLPELQKLSTKLETVEKELKEQDNVVKSLRASNEDLASQLAVVSTERDKYLSQVESFKSNNADVIYLAQIKELENLLVQTQRETKFYKEKLASHDAAAKKAITDLKGRLDQVVKVADEANKEKDSMVMKYASRESKVLDLVQMAEKLEGRLRDMGREKEVIVGNFKITKLEKQKLGAAFDAKCSELNGLQKQLEKQKEAVSTCDVRVQWAQNKLKSELDAHKETKAKLEETARKLSEAKEETNIIRKDCQAMIKTYQESEEIKSNSLDIELKKKNSKLQQSQQEKSDVVEVHVMTKRELDSLKVKHKDLMEEVKTLRDKVQCHEEERLTNESTMNKFRDIMQNQKKTNKELNEKLREFHAAQAELQQKQEEVDKLQQQIDALRQDDVEMEKDMELCKSREGEMLELTERMTAKNAELQSENSGLQGQVSALTAQKEHFEKMSSDLSKTQQKLSSDVSVLSKAKQSETSELVEKLREKTIAMEALTVQLEDKKDENRTLKRRHTTNIKELTKELQQVRRKLENHENQSDTRSGLSAGSRTSSNGSLDTVSNSNGVQAAPPAGKIQEAVQQDISDMPEIQVCEPDRQKLIEKVVKLQRAHARKNEKLEFMDDHIKQMVLELKKKNRIIQMYVLREESGALIPQSMDENKLGVTRELKAQLSKKGGVMASVYNSHAHDSHMTLDLSLEINHKLQAVLEDTILKNITLKESLDTLGTEISRLSQENRQLQLNMQGAS